MSIPVIVFGDTAGRYISAIESQRGQVSVARHAQDFSEVLGFAQTGIARAVLIVGEHEEISRSLLGQLAEQDLGIVMVTDPGSSASYLPYCVHISTLDEDDSVLEAIVRSVLMGPDAFLNNPATQSQTKDSQDGVSEKLIGVSESVDEVDTDANRERDAPLDKFRNSLSTVQKGQERGQGKIVTVWGGAGSPGRSTVAVNLAAFALDQGMKVCLVDADTYAPSVSALLGMLEDYSGLAQICHVAERQNITENAITDSVSTIKISGKYLDILTGITRPNRWAELRSQALDQVLVSLRSHYDLVVVDTGSLIEDDEELSFDGLAPRRNAATISALTAADDILFLGSGDVLGIPRAIRCFEDLTTLLENSMVEPRISVWINRLRKTAVGSSPEESIKAAWKRFGPSQSIQGFFPYAAETIDSSWLGGKTLLESAPKSEISEAMKTALSYVLGEAEALGPETEQRRPFSTLVVRRTGSELQAEPTHLKISGVAQKLARGFSRKS